MKLHFLGTGAADWDIRHPQKDKNFRRFSSLLIDDTLLIDPGPCIFEFAETFGYQNLFGSVSTVLCTHRHSDHYAPDSMVRLGGSLTEMELFQTIETDRYRITAYPANHGTAENPKHYAIQSKQDGKAIFYGLDGAWLFYPVYRELIRQRFDLMVFDATIGDIPGDYRIFEHNNLQMVEQMCATLKPCCNRFIISHLARTLHTSHEALVKRMEPSGIEVAYDNLVLEI